jgi:hypothetical protein
MKNFAEHAGERPCSFCGAVWEDSARVLLPQLSERVQGLTGRNCKLRLISAGHCTLIRNQNNAPRVLEHPRSATNRPET